MVSIVKEQEPRKMEKAFKTDLKETLHRGDGLCALLRFLTLLTLEIINPGNLGLPVSAHLVLKFTLGSFVFNFWTFCDKRRL